MEPWQVAAIADGVVAIAYFGISGALAHSLLRAGELGRNRLGTATSLIFFSCAVGHALHAVDPVLTGLGTGVTHAVRHGVAPHDAVWAVLTAGVGVYYWTLRRSYGRLLGGTALFQDQSSGRREAVDVNDSIVQAVVAAKMARQLGREAELDAALDRALESSRELVERLLQAAAEGRTLAAGDFVRGGAEPGKP